MHTTAKISVVLPTYNYAHFLDETIQSVLNQTFQNFELIIVDNHSTDNTDEVVKKYLSDERVSYHKNAKNLGIAGNWNLCLEYANTEYIKFICADDKFHPRMLEKYIAVMDQYPNVSLVTCDKQAFGSKSHQTITPLTHLQNGRYANLHMLLGHYSWIGEPTSVMFRKRDLKVGKFSSEYVQYMDWEMWIRLLTVGDCYIIPEILAYVRFHPASVSTSQKRKRFAVCFEDYKLRKDIQQNKYNIDLTNSGFDKSVRKSAIFCIKQAMLKTIPELHRKESRIAFKKALRIAMEEKLFWTTIIQLFQGSKRKVTRRIAKLSPYAYER